MSIVYIASPYTHPEPAVQEGRYYEVMHFVNWMLDRQGPVPVPFSPILYCHELAKHYDLPTDFLFWRTFNRAIIVECPHIIVLRLPGWDQSKGVRDEIEFVQSRSIPHYYADPLNDGSYILKLA